jgi:hypothetical protein
MSHLGHSAIINYLPAHRLRRGHTGARVPGAHHWHHEAQRGHHGAAQHETVQVYTTQIPNNAQTTQAQHTDAQTGSKRLNTGRKVIYIPTEASPCYTLVR